MELRTAATMAANAMVIVDGEEYLTGEEAAAVLGVKRETLYAYVSRGFLRSYRQGIKRHRLYRQAEVARLVQLAPAPEEPAAGRAPTPEVPLAESWIRD